MAAIFDLVVRKDSMRYLRFLAALLALAILPAVFAAGEASAASQKTPAQLYEATAKDWRELLGNAERGKTRDPWLNLEKRFLDIAAKDSKGDTGAKSRYQASRCREELAKRSHLASDWKQAATLFLALQKNYPRHSLADDGLFQAAFIMTKRLNAHEEARKTAQTIIDTYPKGDMVQNARQLLASLPKSGAAATSPAKPSVKPGSTAKPGTPSTASPTVNATAINATAVNATPEAAQLTRVICRGTSKRSAVHLELDGAAAFRHQFFAATSKSPARLVVDIDGVSMGPDAKALVTPSGLAVSRVRTAVTGTKTKKGVRVTIDLGKVRHYTVDVGSTPPGIHVQCSVSPDLAGGKTPPANGKNGPIIQGRFSGNTPGRPGTLMEQLGLTVKTIMIDAGHGGKDPGAMGNGITEKHVTLTLARLLGERLQAKGFTVLYTRTRDVYVALDQRAVLANNKKADLFISLHVNASKDKATNGLETYFMDIARSNSAATVAARENAVSVKSISDLQFILTDLMLTSKLQESQDLAAIIHQKTYTRVRQAGFTVSDNGVRSAPFYVLMGARMPAVLVEIGYLSHTADANRIKSQKYLERLADGITLGVIEYKNKLSRFSKK
ncbi:MAG: Cell division coordinator CpoB [Desulfovibrio sp.]